MGLNTKRHLAMDAFGLPVRVAVTQGATADCTPASRLIEGLSAEYLRADQGYDTDAVLEQAKIQGINCRHPAQEKRHRSETL